MIRVWEITYKEIIKGVDKIDMVRIVANHDDYQGLFYKWAADNPWKSVYLVSANMIGFAEDFTAHIRVE